MSLTPPPNKVFDTEGLLVRSAKAHAAFHGFAVTILRSKKNKKGVVHKIWLNCDRGGKYRARDLTPENRVRFTSSRCIKCPFSAIGKMNELGEWILSTPEPNHNHPPSSSRSAHPSIRKMELPKHLDQIMQLSKAGSEPHQIMSALRQAYPDLELITSDIYNARKSIKRTNLRGHTPIQALVHELEESRYYHQIKTNDIGNITHLFFAHPQSLQNLKLYPDVLLMDCTYKTNRFKMPLLNIVGVTNLSTTFNVTFVLLAEEAEGDYVWVMQVLKTILDKPGYSYPTSVVTDRKLALMSALRVTFPGTFRILCEWHVQKNVQVKAAKAFKEEEEKVKFMKAWAGVITSSTRLEYTNRWDTLFEEYETEYADLVWYIKDTWLDFKWNMVKHWMDLHLHFGNRATSRVEGAHSALKRYLQVSNGDLQMVLTKVDLMLRNQHVEHEAALAFARSRLPHDLNISIFLELIGRVTPFALRKILKQYQRPFPLPECTKSFRKSMGLPCAHLIQERRQNQEDIHLHDIHLHWHLDRPDPNAAPGNIELGAVMVREPQVARTRGRPRGSKNRQPISSTQRDP